MSLSVPTIKFFTKHNGTSVAYAQHGSGPVLIVSAWWVSHIDLDWSVEAYKQFFIKLGAYFTVVRYDRPGVGLSDRKRCVFTLEEEVDTLGELIAHLGTSEVSLFGVSCGGPPSIAYAHAYPERIKQLIFIDSYASGDSIGAPKIQDALCALIAAHWGLGAKAILDLFDPDMDTDTRAQVSHIHRRSASPSMAEALLKLSFRMDATDAARLVTTPALIIHRSNDKTVPFNAGRKLAALLPNAQLVSIDGKAHAPWLGGTSDKIIDEIIRFSGFAPSADGLISEHNQFRKTGNVWALSYSGKTAHVKDSRGLNDLALLIQRQDEEVHVADMMVAEHAVPQESQSQISDHAAIQQYRHRMREILEEKSQAAAVADELRYSALEREEEEIIGVLKQSVGLGGRPRVFNNSAEKARKAVAARIRVALKKIGAVAPELGEHLSSAVKTGTYCSYSPGSDIKWLT